MAQIIPAILAQTQEEFKEKLESANRISRETDNWIQIDFMDNKFVQNQSVTPSELSQYLNEGNIEAHLMVEEPEPWIEELEKYPGVKRIIVHVERVSNLKKGDYEIGLALNPETELESLTPFVTTIDCVLVMSVHPGFAGQEFIEDSINKVAEIKKRWPELIIEVDGGVNLDNAKRLVEAGADRLAIGSALFEGNIDENVKKIKESLTS